jgi:hypothetical protein
MTSPFGPLVLIANPQAGRGRVERALPRVEQVLRRQGLDYRIVRTTHLCHATEASREAVRGGERFLVAMGGDGTVHEVVNGMLEDGRASDAVLGVVAVGSGCDFVRSFGLAGDVEQAAGRQDAPLPQRLTDQAELPVLQVPQPAVHEPGGTPRRPGREVVLLHQRHGKPARRRVERDAGPGDPAPDDQHVDRIVGHPGQVGRARPRRELQHQPMLTQWLDEAPRRPNGDSGAPAGRARAHSRCGPGGGHRREPFR